MHPLEERSNMNGTFPGRIVLAEGDEVDVDLHFAPAKIRLATSFAEIGLWDRESIHFDRNPAGGFELSIADDVVTFYPTDHAGFAEAINGHVSPENSTSGGFDGLSAMESDEDSSVLPRVVDEDESSSDVSGHDVFSDDTASSDGEFADVGLPAAVVEEGASDPEITPPGDSEELVSKFGRSSRERLASAMTDFRDRQEASEADSNDALVDPSDASIRSEFLIPGDEGYVFPDDGEIEEVSVSEIHDEEVTVADEILASQRSLRSATKVSFDKSKIKKFAVGVGILLVLVGIGFAIPIVLNFFASSPDVEAASTPTTVAVTASTVDVATTVVATTAPQFSESVFDLPAPVFVDRWNELAAQVSPSLRFRSSLPAGDFEVGFTPFIAMLGVSDSSATGSMIESFTLEVDPTGPSASDRLGIQALGLAIAVADPSLQPSERGSVLGEMGLNVRDPSLAGLDGRTSRNGIEYQLFYDAEAVLLRMEVAPRG